MPIDIKIKRNITELGHSDRLKNYVNPSKIYANSGFKSIQMTNSLEPLFP